MGREFGMKRRHSKQYNVHHRRPKCYNGSNDPNNLVVVKKSHHFAFHQLFSENGHAMDVHAIARTLNDTWIDPRYKLVVERR